jgi:hypothetical protein
METGIERNADNKSKIKNPKPEKITMDDVFVFSVVSW